MSGGAPAHQTVRVHLAQPLKLDPVRPEYHRASLSWAGDHFEASTTGMQRSSRIMSIRDADCLLHLPNQAGTLPKGTPVTATVLTPLQCRGPAVAETPPTTEVEAAVFRSLVQHFQARTDVQNIDVMNLTGFCRNCLSKWYVNASKAAGAEISIAEAKELVYGMPYKEWKAKYQTPATKEQMEKLKVSHGHHDHSKPKKAAQHSDVCCSKAE